MEEEKPSLKSVLRDLESEVSSLRTGIAQVLARKPPMQARILLDLVEDTIGNLVALREDLEALAEMRSPIAILEIDEIGEDEDAPHPCDSCIVVEENLDGEEHCPGCVNEGLLQDYVPPYLRKPRGYIELTEVSAEEDG